MPQAREDLTISGSSSDLFPRLSSVPQASKAPSQSRIPLISSARIQRVEGFLISLINPLFPHSLSAKVVLSPLEHSSNPSSRYPLRD